MQIVHNKLDQQTWDAFVLKHGPRSGRFLQSFAWGEFMKKVGEGEETVDRIAWMSDVGEGQAPPNIIAVAQVMQKTIPHFGTYAYVPRGPILAPSSFEALPAGRQGEGGGRGLTDRSPFVNMSDLSVNDMFVRVELATEHPSHALPSMRRGITRTENVQPAHTLITDLTISTDELLSNMHEKTRYNIRLAEKKGVKIEMSSATIDEVWPVFEATASRDAFRLHGKEYYRKMIESGVAFFAIAKHENDILAANIMIDFGDTRTYLHGASSNVKRNLMAPYLLHFELMKDAQSKGIKFYDWWGVAPLDAPANHTWAGISRFKRGFGGEEVSYPDAFDVVLKPMRYATYRFVRAMRRMMR